MARGVGGVLKKYSQLAAILHSLRVGFRTDSEAVLDAESVPARQPDNKISMSIVSLQTTPRTHLETVEIMKGN